MKATRILLTGDILRPSAQDPSRPEATRRIQWFEDLLSPVLAQVTDLPVSRLCVERGGLDLIEIYRSCGRHPSLDEWARLYAGEFPPILHERITEWCRDALVIGVEMAPSVVRVLRDAGVAVIDCAVDPLRFLYDIPLAWRSTETRVRAALEPFRVSAFEIQRRAAQIRAKTRWIAEIAVPEGATLVLDQVPGDSALIDPARQRFVDWSDYREHLVFLRQQGPVMWRSHPLNAGNGPLAEVLGKSTETPVHFYRLVAHQNLAGVAAISSGGVVEARAFGKQGQQFLDRYAGFDLPDWGNPVPVVGHWYSPHFWKAILEPLTPTRDEVPVVPVEKDFLRRSVNCDWGFGWIDRTVIT